MASNTVWGLDIGNSAIKAVKMVRTGNDCKIVEFDIIDIANADEDKDRAVNIAGAMATLTSNHKFGYDPVFLAVTGNVCLHREFNLPPGSETKVHELVQFEARQQIPFPLDQVEWGYESYNDENGVSVALIAVRKNDIQEMLNIMQKFKLNVRGITAAPMALYNFIHYEFKPTNTTLILDAGAKGTDFVVMNKKQIYFRTIQIAGREITRVLENKFKVAYDKAEELKKNIGQSPQSDKILAVIEPTLRQLGAEVQRTIGFWKSKARGQRVNQCYLLGHTFRLPKMAEYLQSQVREAPFAIVEGLQKVQIDSSVNPEVWQTEFPTMAVAIGLGVQGLGLSELKVNLIPQDTTAIAAQANQQKWAAAAVVVILGSLYCSHMNVKKNLENYGNLQVKMGDTLAKVKKLEEEEKAAVVGLAERELAAKRLSRAGRDRGKITQIAAKMMALTTPDGVAFFGTRNKVHITNLYASRTPVLFKGSLGANDRRELASSQEAQQHLKGPRSFYAALAKGPDTSLQPAELRPDVPLVVVLTAEVEAGMFSQVNAQLIETLGRLPEIKNRDKDGIRVVKDDKETVYAETPLEYTWKGEFKAPTNPLPEQDKPKHKYQRFHVLFQWDDPADPDVEPTEAPAQPEKGPKKK